MKIQNEYDFCERCSHFRYEHLKGNFFTRMILGWKPVRCKCYHFDYNLPFWQRKRIYCPCNGFVEEKNEK